MAPRVLNTCAMTLPDSIRAIRLADTFPSIATCQSCKYIDHSMRINLQMILGRNVKLVSSNSEAFRMIEQGCFKINDEKVVDRKHQVTLEDFKDDKIIIQKGKKKFIAVVLK